MPFKTAAQQAPTGFKSQQGTPQQPQRTSAAQQGPAAFNPDDPLSLQGRLGDPFARAQSLTVDPALTSSITKGLFRMLSQSPAFQNILRGITQQGARRGTAIQSGLGRTGLSASGVGGVQSGLAGSATANQISGARGDLFSQALMTALQQMQNLPGAAGMLLGLEQEKAATPKTTAGKITGGII